MTAAANPALMLALAITLSACVPWNAGWDTGRDVRRATVLEVKNEGLQQFARISHRHGSTVVHDVALVPHGITVRRGQRVEIDHSLKPPVVVSPASPD
jgi:hypothetical protein